MTGLFCTEGGARLDVFLADETELTRSHIKRLIDAGSVLVNGAPATKAGQTVKAGDEVCYEDEIPSDEIVAQNIPIDVIYEDGDIAVINKRRGLVVHPGAGNRDGTLVNALMFRYGDGLSSAGGAARAGIVHRLDKDTTGLMVIARNNAAHAELCRQFSAREVDKRYRAILDGNLKNDSGVIDAPIGRDRHNRLKMAVTPDGRRAVTEYEVLERFSGFCYVKFKLLTGRTHQIRVHAAKLGHPVACDPLYGGSGTLKCDGQLLHSGYLAFTHPATGKRLEFTADEPADFAAALATLRSKEQSK